MDWITGIQQAIDYMEEHITDELDFTEIARQSACSPFYFQRIFGILCGISLSEYIRLRRQYAQILLPRFGANYFERW